MGLADALRCTSVVYEKRGAILLRMCMKMHFFLLEVLWHTYRVIRTSNPRTLTVLRAVSL
jgi:hypothetical protein